MALTEIYVDPSIAGDSGTGTIGDPYGDLEYAIVQSTFDTTNGTRVNIKAGTDEVLAAGLQTALADTSVSVAWATSATAPLIFQGYTTTAGDGGIGGISGGSANFSIIDSQAAAGDYIHFVDLHLHSTGTAWVVKIGDYGSVVNCEIDNATGGGVWVIIGGLVRQCTVHNVGSIGINIANSGTAAYNYVYSDGAPFTNFGAIVSSGAYTQSIYRNIILLEESGSNQDGIRVSNGAPYIAHNSIWSNTGTGCGITVTSNSVWFAGIENNLIEGFSGTGGVGIELSVNTGVNVRSYLGNSVFDCATAFAAPSTLSLVESGNETLSASPFTSAATGDFSPVDTGSINQGALPQSFGQ